MARATSKTCTVDSFRLASHRNSIFLRSALKVLATTARVMRPAVSPGPYTSAGRSSTTGSAAPAARSAAASARAQCTAGSVQGACGAASSAPAPPCFSGLYTAAEESWMSFFTPAPAAAAAHFSAAATPLA